MKEKTRRIIALLCAVCLLASGEGRLCLTALAAMARPASYAVDTAVEDAAVRDEAPGDAEAEPAELAENDMDSESMYYAAAGEDIAADAAAVSAEAEAVVSDAEALVPPPSESELPYAKPLVSSKETRRAHTAKAMAAYTFSGIDIRLIRALLSQQALARCHATCDSGASALCCSLKKSVYLAGWESSRPVLRNLFRTFQISHDCRISRRLDDTVRQQIDRKRLYRRS